MSAADVLHDTRSCPRARHGPDCTGKESRTVASLRPPAVTEFAATASSAPWAPGINLDHDHDDLYVNGPDRDGGEAGRRAGGPIRIAKAAGEASYAGWVGILNLVIALSVGLAVFNPLPVPMFNGGQLAMYLYEAVRGRPLSSRLRSSG